MTKKIWIKLFIEEIVDDPNDYLAQGIADNKAGQIQEARRLLSAVIQQNPNDEDDKR